MKINFLIVILLICSIFIVASNRQENKVSSRQKESDLDLSKQSSLTQADLFSQEDEILMEGRLLDQLSSEEERQILMLLDDFQYQEKKNNDYEKYITSLRTLLTNSAIEILNNENLTKSIKNKFQEFNELPFTKYRDYVFEKYGFIINSTYPGYHILLLQIEEDEHWIYSPFKENTFTIRYQIVPDKHLPAGSDITNVSLVFLNKDRFEISKIFIGDLKEGHTVTGKFEISKKQYCEIRSVKSITDQDSWDPGLVHFDLSATRYR